jgi:hypothetical protein
VGKRRDRGPSSSNCVSLLCRPFKHRNFYIIYAVSTVVVSLYATVDMCWFGMCWGHVTDVPRTGCVRLGSATRRVSFYTSLDGGGLRPSGPSSGPIPVMDSTLSGMDSPINTEPTSIMDYRNFRNTQYNGNHNSVQWS